MYIKSKGATHFARVTGKRIKSRNSSVLQLASTLPKHLIHKKSIAVVLSNSFDSNQVLNNLIVSNLKNKIIRFFKCRCLKYDERRIFSREHFAGNSWELISQASGIIYSKTTEILKKIT